MQVQISNKFFAKNETQLRRKLETMNIPAFIKMEEIDEETIPVIQFYHKNSELNHSKLAKKSIKKAILNRAEKKRDIEKFKKIRSGLENLGLEGMNYSQFKQLEKLSGQEFKNNFQGFGEIENHHEETKQIDGNIFSSQEETGYEMFADEEIEKKFKKRDEEVKDLNRTIQEEKGINTAQEQGEKKPFVGSLRVYNNNNRCEIFLDVATPENVKKHGFKSKIGWGSINESLISALMIEEGLIEKWKNEVKNFFNKIRKKSNFLTHFVDLEP